MIMIMRKRLTTPIDMMSQHNIKNLDGSNEEEDTLEDDMLVAIPGARAVQTATCDSGELAPLAAALAVAIIPPGGTRESPNFWYVSYIGICRNAQNPGSFSYSSCCHSTC